MDKNTIISFPDITRLMFKDKYVIIGNRLNGAWMKIPSECYKILEQCNNDKLTVGDLDQMLHDDEDRQYMNTLISSLDNMGLISTNLINREVDNISLAITHRCNLKCIHCMVDATYGSFNKEIFDTETIFSFLQKIIEVNPKNIVITGGEPMLRKDFLEILYYLKKHYTGKITLMTNGTLFTKDNIGEIINIVSAIDISLDGADEKSCSVIRGSGVFTTVVENIKLLHEKGFRNISLSMVLSANNINYVDKFFQLNKDLQTHPMLRALSYEGRAYDNKDILLENYSDEKLKDEPQQAKDYEPRVCTCTAGYNQLTIESNGDIFPCNLFVQDSFKLGNIYEIDNLQSMFNNEQGEFISQCIQKYEPSKFLKCKDCNINYLCWDCIYPMFALTDDEFKERCDFKYQALSRVWK